MTGLSPVIGLIQVLAKNWWIMEIDRFGPEPAYVQIANWLRQRITSGDLPPGTPIPSKKQIRQELGVAGQTVDKAVQILKDEGLVATARGLGIYVIDTKKPRQP